MKKDDIEDVFKQSFDNYEPEVGSKVWKNIKVFLKWGGLAFFINAFIQKIGLTTFITLVVSLTAVIGGAVAYNWNDNKATAPIAQQTVLVKDSNSLVATAVEPTATPVETATNTESEQKLTVTTAVSKNDESLASIQASITSGTAPLIVDFSNTGKGKSNKWVFSDDTKEIATTHPVRVFDVAGTYTILLTSSNVAGNVDTDTLSIEVSGPNPKVIKLSPNGDSINDVLKLNIEKKLTSMSAKIVDKNGTVVYQAETAGEWSGKDLKGKELPNGFYYYIINAEGLKGNKYDQKGIINLKR
jgi:gliding motility-associated-like protein